jgi:hypothetical protein
MVFGNAVLLDRVATIVPTYLANRFVAVHYVILGVRFAIGIVDAVIINVSAADNGTCIYEDNIVVCTIQMALCYRRWPNILTVY